MDTTRRAGVAATAGIITKTTVAPLERIKVLKNSTNIVLFGYYFQHTMCFPMPFFLL